VDADYKKQQQRKTEERQLAILLGQGQAASELGKGAKNLTDAGVPLAQ
jgi:hypothetical protein